MKLRDRTNALIPLSMRFLPLTSAFIGLLGASVIAFPLPPADASISLFSAARDGDKQARGSVPGRRRGGARRGTCPETETQLVALVPATEIETETLPETYVGSVTAAGYPTIWFDVPYQLTNELTAEFVLQDEQGQDVYRRTLFEAADVEQTSGLVSMSLPSELSPLEIGKTYQWYFKINCGSESPLYVQGGIERVRLDADLTNQIENAMPLAQAELYQENEVWYDAINVVAQLRRSQPDDPTVDSAWMDLLRSLDIQNLQE